jgi:hypothetical protein
MKIIMRLFCLFAAATLLSAADVKEFHKTVPLDPAGRFSLDTYKGSIRISVWDQPQAEIHARIVADPFTWFAVPVDDVDIRVDNSPGSVRVKTDYRHRTLIEGNLPDVQYTIHVPRRVALSIKDYKSDSDVTGVEGAVDFETYKGTVRLNGLRAALHLNTYKGEVHATFASFTAASRVDTYKGDIDLTLPRSAAFDLSTKLERRARLDSDFARTFRSTAHERGFRSSINGGGPELRVNSFRGDIRLRSSN